jgi:hypothetical protein
MLHRKISNGQLSILLNISLRKLTYYAGIKNNIIFWVLREVALQEWNNLNQLERDELIYILKLLLLSKNGSHIVNELFYANKIVFSNDRLKKFIDIYKHGNPWKIKI